MPEFRILQKIRPVVLRLGLTIFIAFVTLTGNTASCYGPTSRLCLR